MGKILKSVFAMLIVGFPALAFSDVYFATGLVKGIYWSHDTEGTFTIEGFNAAGTCPINDHLVAIAFPQDARASSFTQSIVLSSHIAGKPVSVRVDDGNRTEDGLCYLYVVERIN